MRAHALALLLSLPLAAAEPIAPAPVGPAYGLQQALAIGTNDAGRAFVVWSDFRDGLTNLRGSRVDEFGELTEPSGVVLTTLVPYRARVVADGEGWRVEAGTSYLRVAPDLTVTPLQVLEPPPPFTHEELRGPYLRASNGSETLVAGRRIAHDAAQIVTVRLGADGAPLGPPVIFPPQVSYAGELADLSWNGREWVLLLRNFIDLYAFRLDSTGALIGTPLLVEDELGAQTIRTATFGDGALAVLYADGPTTSRVARIAGSEVTRSGPIAGLPGGIAAATHGFLAATNIGGGVAVVPLRRDLTLGDAETEEETRSRAAQQGFATDKSQEARLLVGYEEDGRGIGRLMGRRPEFVEKLALLPSALDQRDPAVARVGTTHFVVWQERGANGHQVQGMLFDYRNEPLLYEPVMIGRGNGGPPAVVWSGHYFLVAWHDPFGQLHLHRVTAGGVVVGGEIVASLDDTPSPRAPVLVRAGSVIFLIRQDGSMEAPCVIFPCGGMPARIEAMRFDLVGQRIDRSPIVVAGEELSARPDAAWNGRLVRVAWHRDGRIYTRDLDVAGNVHESGLAPIEGDFPSVIAIGEELIVAANVELWRGGVAVQQPIDGVPTIFVDIEPR